MFVDASLAAGALAGVAPGIANGVGIRVAVAAACFSFSLAFAFSASITAAFSFSFIFAFSWGSKECIDGGHGRLLALCQ